MITTVLVKEDSSQFSTRTETLVPLAGVPIDSRCLCDLPLTDPLPIPLIGQGIQLTPEDPISSEVFSANDMAQPVDVGFFRRTISRQISRHLVSRGCPSRFTSRSSSYPCRNRMPRSRHGTCRRPARPIRGCTPS